jgi:peptidoglycan/LPS O-acetylase OafA/YrhL
MFRLMTLGSIVVFLATLYAPSILKADIRIFDLAIGLSFSALIFFVTKIDIRNEIVSRAAKGMAGFSYTLYLTHFPFLALLSCMFLANQKLQLDAASLGIYLGAFFVTVFYAFCIYLLFERNTKKLQKDISRLSN